MLKLAFLTIFRKVILLIKTILFLIIVFLGLNYFVESIRSDELFKIGFAIITPLAVTLSFSSLMYSRSRAIKSKVQQFKSLYIAERLMTASGYYSVSILIFLLSKSIAKQLNFDISFKGSALSNYNFLFLIVPSIFFMLYCQEIFFSIKALSLHTTGRSPKDVAKDIKKLL